MNKLNILNESFFEKNDINKENKKNIESNNVLDKILCNHCERTINNGIRCLGICVADNEY